MFGNKASKRAKNLNNQGEERINVYATEQGALYIKVEELFALKKVQMTIAKAMKVEVLGQKRKS
jgi:hypothetical protein